MTTIEYLQTKIDYLTQIRYLHEDVSDTVCEALDLAIQYIEQRIIELEQPTEEEYQEYMREQLDTIEDLNNSQI